MLPWRIGVWTKLRKGSTIFSMTGPSLSSKPLPFTRLRNSAQIRSSSHSATFSLGSHWKYIRWTVSVRWLIRAKPFSELA
ncbi:hypothetical protein SRABI83_04603 [Arthrobacter sp. Bi83]|nr:hypothetical protein SRABI83_04603 [Arthrobacter sp. Bi83]